VAGMKKPNDHAEPTKSRTLKKQKQKHFWGCLLFKHKPSFKDILP